MKWNKAKLVEKGEMKTTRHIQTDSKQNIYVLYIMSNACGKDISEVASNFVCWICILWLNEGHVH